jgi:hypothetical protein
MAGTGEGEGFIMETGLGGWAEAMTGGANDVSAGAGLKLGA